MIFEGFYKRSERILLVLVLVLILPAFLIQLGEPIVLDDEGIRAVVAMEMELQDDYLTPTLGGDLYFKKPPLYNWVLSAFMQGVGSYSPFVLRLPNVFFLLLFGTSIWWFVRKIAGNRVAVFAALAFITSGRILFYESFYALIDILFSYVVFLQFMVIYFSYKKGNYLRLFLWVYILTAIAFMLKSLPALVFTAVSLFVFFVWKRKWKMLFSWQHILGIVILFVSVGSYYYFYFERNAITIEDYLHVLFSESTKRTVTDSGLFPMFAHILSYPFELIGHFIPWTLLVFAFYKRAHRQRIINSEFMVFLLLMFVANILLYWISPEVHPRYVLMLIPLIYIPFIDVYEKGLVWRNRGEWFLGLVILLLVARIGMSAFLLESRNENDVKSIRKEMAHKIVKLSEGETVYAYWAPRFPNSDYYGRRCVTYDFMYYYTAEKKEMLQITDSVESGKLYLMKYYHFNEDLFVKIDTFNIYPNYSYYHTLARGK